MPSLLQHSLYEPLARELRRQQHGLVQYGYVGTLNALPALLPQDPGLNQALPVSLDSGLSLHNLPGIGQDGACIAH